MSNHTMDKLMVLLLGQRLGSVENVKFPFCDRSSIMVKLAIILTLDK
ncbi:MAG TPA: hypothetical protein V6D28_27705 [Leptolyngbyaceae cyanobacterium]